MNEFCIINYSKIYVDEEYTFTTLFIENKGVRPAKLKSFSLILDETLVTDFQSIGKVLESIFENEENYVHSYKLPDGLLSANSKISILEIKKKRKASDLLDFKNIDIAFTLCYCSIYGDCWTITETNREPKEVVMRFYEVNVQ